MNRTNKSTKQTRRWLSGATLLVIALLRGGVADSSYAATPTHEPQQNLPPVIIMDDTFNPNFWRESGEVSGGGTFTATQQLTDGNDDEFRFISHTLPPVPAGELYTVSTNHLLIAPTYNPFGQGEIRVIDYQEDGIILSFPFADAFSTTQPLIEQNGRLFRSTKFLRFTAQNSSHDWETKSLNQLTANDFVAVDGSGDHPNFLENGGTMRFGFTRTNSRSDTQPIFPSDQELVIDQGVDNWQITIHRDNTNRPPQAVDDVYVLDGSSGLPGLQFFHVLDNDSDSNLDRLKLVDVSEPLIGSASILVNSVAFQSGVGDFVDSFTYTVSDDDLTDEGRVEVYIDCACTLECLSIGVARGLINATDQFDLRLIYHVRDFVLKPTPHGQRYVDMYYTNNPEILVKIMANNDLRIKSLETVVIWQPALRSLVYGDGSFTITQGQIDVLDSFLTDLSAVASDELQEIISDERERLGPLDNYVGMSIIEAKTAAIGDAILYVPSVHANP